VFPKQSLSQEDLIRVTGYFGELGELSRPAKYFPKGYSRLLPGIMLISNIRENGEPIGALPDGEMMWEANKDRTRIRARRPFCPRVPAFLKKPAKSWRVIIIRSKGEYLGSVEAADRERAEAVLSSSWTWTRTSAGGCLSGSDFSAVLEVSRSTCRE
jgi:hypothetical protein